MENQFHWLDTRVLLIYYVLNYLAIDSLQIVYKWTSDTFGWAMLAGFTSFIVTSLLTKPEDSILVEKFFTKMSLLSDDNVLSEHNSKPLAADSGKGLLFSI